MSEKIIITRDNVADRINAYNHNGDARDAALQIASELIEHYPHDGDYNYMLSEDDMRNLDACIAGVNAREELLQDIDEAVNADEINDSERNILQGYICQHGEDISVTDVDCIRKEFNAWRVTNA